MFISSRQDRQILQSNTEIPYHDSVIKSCSTAKLRGVTCTVCHGMITLKLLQNNAIHISICDHESNYISQLRIVKAFITHLFSLIGCVIWGNCTHYLEEELVRLQKRAARVILDCDVYTPSSTMFFLILNGCHFRERVIYMKAIQMFITIRGDAPEYLRSSFTFASDMHTRCYVHRPIYSCILQNLIQKYIVIHLYVQVHPFGIPFLHIFIIQIQVIILKPNNIRKNNTKVSLITYNKCERITIYI